MIVKVSRLNLYKSNPLATGSAAEHHPNHRSRPSWITHAATQPRASRLPQPQRRPSRGVSRPRTRHLRRTRSEHRLQRLHHLRSRQHQGQRRLRLWRRPDRRRKQQRLTRGLLDRARRRVSRPRRSRPPRVSRGSHRRGGVCLRRRFLRQQPAEEGHHFHHPWRFHPRPRNRHGGDALRDRNVSKSRIRSDRQRLAPRRPLQHSL